MSTILLVEDDAWLKELYENALSDDPSITVLTAENAETALKKIDEYKNISLIILDIFLPDHSGIELLHELGSYNDTAKIPIIILSSIAQSDFAMNQERWRHYGVVSHLYKPSTKPHQLLTEVKKQLLARVA